MKQREALGLAEEHLESFKLRMRIFGTFEDDNLVQLLSSSFLRVSQLIGAYDPNDNLNFIELVFERSRYAYNDSLEYFEDNYQSMILDCSFFNYGGEFDAQSKV